MPTKPLSQNTQSNILLHDVCVKFQKLCFWEFFAVIYIPMHVIMS